MFSPREEWDGAIRNKIVFVGIAKQLQGLGYMRAIGSLSVEQKSEGRV